MPAIAPAARPSHELAPARGPLCAEVGYHKPGDTAHRHDALEPQVEHARTLRDDFAQGGQQNRHRQADRGRQ